MTKSIFSFVAILMFLISTVACQKVQEEVTPITANEVNDTSVFKDEAVTITSSKTFSLLTGITLGDLVQVNQDGTLAFKSTIFEEIELEDRASFNSSLENINKGIKKGSINPFSPNDERLVVESMIENNGTGKQYGTQGTETPTVQGLCFCDEDCPCRFGSPCCTLSFFGWFCLSAQMC